MCKCYSCPHTHKHHTRRSRWMLVHTTHTHAHTWTAIAHRTMLPEFAKLKIYTHFRRLWVGRLTNLRDPWLSRPLFETARAPPIYATSPRRAECCSIVDKTVRGRARRAARRNNAGGLWNDIHNKHTQHMRMSVLVVLLWIILLGWWEIYKSCNGGASSRRRILSYIYRHTTYIQTVLLVVLLLTAHTWDMCVCWYICPMRSGCRLMLRTRASQYGLGFRLQLHVWCRLGRCHRRRQKARIRNRSKLIGKVEINVTG